MHEDDSPVEKMNERLYSRTEYVPPEDARSPVRAEPPPDAPAGWNSPQIDSLIAEHKDEEEHTHFKTFFIIAGIIFLIALGVAGYVFYGGGNFISTKNVDIAVTGPASINAGEPLSLSVTIDNKNNAPLDNVTLSIQYPDGTRSADNPEQSLSRDQQKIDTLAAGGESVQTFRSALYGQKGDVLEMKLTLEYEVGGSSALFSKEKTFDVTIGDTPVTLSIEHPSSVTSGQAYDTQIIIASNSSDIIHNVVVQAEYPYGYALSSSDPAAAQNGNFWTLGDLSPGDKKTITLHGSISGVDAEERTFRYYAGEADPGSPYTLKQALVSTTDTLAISRPDVGISLTLNGESGSDYVAPAGGDVDAVISYQNNSTSKLTGTIITARITGASLDKTSIKPSQGGFYDSNTGLVTWTSPGVSDLAALAPGDEGSVSVSFASQSSLPVGQSASLGITASISGTPDGVASADKLENSVSKTVKISSTVNFSGKALYSRGPFTNTGVIPPKAEATTTYTVIFDLGNTQNDVSAGKVTASLGPNVTFVSAGSGSDQVAYDASSNTLTWDVGTLASGTGFSAPLREAAFQVALKPSIGQIGTVPTLVQSISFMGTDAFTHLPVAATLPAITTHLASDPAFVQGDDAVAK